MEQHDWDRDDWPVADDADLGPLVPPDGAEPVDAAASTDTQYPEADTGEAPVPPDAEPDWAAAHQPDLGYADGVPDGGVTGDGVTGDDVTGDDPAGVGPVAEDRAAAGIGVVVGTDPDLVPHADDGRWAEDLFPPEVVGLDRPEPVDGYPWADPTLLGRPDLDQAAGVAAAGVAAAGVSGPDAGADPGVAGSGRQPGDAALVDPDPADLAAYDGTDLPAGADAWAALRASQDPATNALAHWWAPGTSRALP
ncbi:MAG TPA: hypothetical protein VK453_23935 [Micromonosporaceae bacterium]|nr:hypothetical protein [Micromonosporaceae bacterium]